MFSSYIVTSHFGEPFVIDSWRTGIGGQHLPHKNFRGDAHAAQMFVQDIDAPDSYWFWLCRTHGAFDGFSGGDSNENGSVARDRVAQLLATGKLTAFPVPKPKVLEPWSRYSVADKYAKQHYRILPSAAQLAIQTKEWHRFETREVAQRFLASLPFTESDLESLAAMIAPSQSATPLDPNTQIQTALVKGNLIVAVDPLIPLKPEEQSPPLEAVFTPMRSSSLGSHNRRRQVPPAPPDVADGEADVRTEWRQRC